MSYIQGRVALAFDILESTGDIGLVNEGKQFLVRATFEIAIGLAQVNVDEGFLLDGGHGAKCSGQSRPPHVPITVDTYDAYGAVYAENGRQIGRVSCEYKSQSEKTWLDCSVMVRVIDT